MKACEPLRREAESQGVHIAEVAGWPEWRHEAQRLERAGRAILAGEDTYGAYLDAVAAGKPRARLTVDQLRSRIEDGRVRAAKPEKPERSPRSRESTQQEGVAYILDDPREAPRAPGAAEEARPQDWQAAQEKPRSGHVAPPQRGVGRHRSSM